MLPEERTEPDIHQYIIHHGDSVDVPVSRMGAGKKCRPKRFLELIIGPWSFDQILVNLKCYDFDTY